MHCFLWSNSNRASHLYPNALSFFYTKTSPGIAYWFLRDQMNNSLRQDAIVGKSVALQSDRKHDDHLPNLGKSGTHVCPFIIAEMVTVV